MSTIKKLGHYKRGKQEYSSRTLGWTWAIICAVMLPFIVVLICIGWRILKRKKAEEKEDTYMIRSRHIDPDESMKINSDDDSIPYKKGLDSPSAVEPEKTADNDQLATSPSPGFQYEAAQPFGQNLNLDENFDSNNPKSKELGYPDMYTYNTASPFNAASPAPYGGARLSESPTAFQPASTAAFQPASPTTFQPASPTTFQPASPTAFQPASPALFNPVSPAPSNPPFNEPFQPNQEVVYPSTSHNQRQQPNQQWSGETEIN